jgi:hypothetical protein
MATVLSSKKLLAFVADHELGAFADELGINVTGSDPRGEIGAALPKFSRARLIRALLRATSAYISMLRDVVCFLESRDSKVRTTGFIVALPTGRRDLQGQRTLTC